MPITITYDPALDVAYISLKPIADGEAKRTVPVKTIDGGSLHLDLNAKGQVIGMEVLGVLTVMPIVADLYREQLHREQS